MRHKLLKVLRPSLVGLIITALIATPALAQDYFANIQVVETAGVDYDMLGVIKTLNVNNLIDEGYLTATGLDSRVMSGSAELPRMLQENRLLFAVPTPANSSTQCQFVTGYDSASNFDVITGYGGYITIDDDDELELGDTFEIEQKGYIDTDAGSDKSLVYREDTFRLWVSDSDDGRVSAAILDTSTNMRQDLKFYLQDWYEPGGTTYYSGLMGSYLRGLTTDVSAAQIIPTAGTISRLRIWIGDGVLAGDTLTFTVMKNGVATDIEVVMTEGETEDSDLLDSINVVAEDTVSLRGVLSDIDSEDAYYISGAVVFESSTADETIYMVSDALHSKTIDVYHMLTGQMSGQQASSHALTFEGDGTAKKLYVKLTADPGTDPDAYSYTLRKDGGDTDLTCTIVANDTTGDDTVHTVDLTSGDLINIEISPVDTPVVAPKAAISLVIEQDTKFEQQVMGWQGSTLALRYETVVQSISSSWKVSELDAAQCVAIRQALSIFTVRVNIAPGVGESRTYTVMRNGVATDMAVTISGTDTTGTDSAHLVSLVAGDTVSLRSSATAGSAASTSYWTILATTSEYLIVVTVEGVSSGERTVIAEAASDTFALRIYDEDDELIGSDTSGMGGESVPSSENNWILNQGDVMPYMEYYKHTVGEIVHAWYEPNTIIEGTTLIDRSHYALDFDSGNPDYIEIPADQIQLDFTSEDFSIIARVKVDDLSIRRYIFARGLEIVDGYRAYIHDSGRLEVYTQQDAAQQVTYSAVGSIVIATWYTLGLSRSGSAITIYKDGVDFTLGAGTHINPATCVRSVKIGIKDNKIGYPFDGKIEFLMVYDRALDENEHLYIHSNSWPQSESGLALWLKMEEGSGNTAGDSSTYGSDGTITTATWVSGETGRPAGDSGTNNGTIVWGANPTGLEVSMGSLISYAEGVFVEPEFLIPEVIGELTDPETMYPAEAAGEEAMSETELGFIPEYIHEQTDTPIIFMWWFLCILLMILALVYTYRYTHHLFMGGIAALVVVGAFVAMGVVPWWFIPVGFLVVVGLSVMERSPSM